ncbi:MAG: 6,7-dimethyl-8-ribityllumazine synthase [Hyphomicrobium sp.]|jgi:6,7-dimethyl-8-ribityllumazine synthase|nr:6,7-dimethyl-8-ribityllumazine synthase [Hyphomicrobium sp.]
MVDRSEDERTAAGTLALARGVRVLIIESPYYAEINGHLLASTLTVLADNGCDADRVSVAGALEIPQALAAAVAAGAIGGEGKRYAGAIALGCVVRGETSHYDIVCNNANHWLMETAIRHSIPVGNAILTVDTREQALARAAGGQPSGKGGDAARACLGLIALKQGFAGASA